LIQQDIESHDGKAVLRKIEQELLSQCRLLSMLGRNAATIPSRGR
jgi:hypothetical protein